MSMRSDGAKRFLALCLIFLLALAGVAGPAAPAAARQPGWDGHDGRGGQEYRGDGRHGGPGYPGPVYGRPPQGHVVVRYHGNPYYYHHGYWYRPYPRGGYVVVRPPVGLFLAALPIGFATLMIGGVAYYNYAGVYYRTAPGGYVVVDPPADYVVTAPAPPVVVQQPPFSSTEPESVAAASVTVISAQLNLRTGPGLNFPIVTVADQGETLTVLGNAPGWLWVRNQAGQTGWVSQQYTAPVISSGASG